MRLQTSLIVAKIGAERIAPGMPQSQDQLNYQELAFHLEYFARSGAFAGCRCRGPEEVGAAQDDQDPGRDLEAINRILLDSARQEKVETGKVVRLDSTVNAAGGPFNR